MNRVDRLVEWGHRVLDPEPMPWQGRLLIAAGSVAGAAWLVLLYVVFVGFADLAGVR